MLQLQRIDSQLDSLSEKLPFNNTLKLYKAMSNVYCRQKKVFTAFEYIHIGRTESWYYSYFEKNIIMQETWV